MKRSRSKDKKKRIINIGVDIGSTTVKVLAMDDSKKNVFYLMKDIFQIQRRHYIIYLQKY